MLSAFLFSLLIAPIACQTSTSAAASQNTSVPATCDYYTTVCSGGSALCPVPGTVGAVLYSSPTATTAFQRIGATINVTWTYSSQSYSKFPQTLVAIYYQLVGASSWTKIAQVGAKTLSTNITISNVSPGSYQLLIMPDDLDVTQTRGVGNKTTCVPPGFPISSIQQIRLIANDGDGMITPYSPNQYGPNANSAAALVASWLIVGIPLFV